MKKKKEKRDELLVHAITMENRQFVRLVSKKKNIIKPLNNVKMIQIVS